MDTTLQHKLDAIADEFLAHLPGRIGAIRDQARLLRPDAWDAGQAQRLYGQLHSLAGTAGTLNQAPLGMAAQALADRLDGWILRVPSADEWAVLMQAIDELDHVPLLRLGGPAEPQELADGVARGHLVYVVDDDRAFARTLGAVLEPRGYRVECFEDLASFAAACRNGGIPELLLVDLDFPGGRTAGAEVMALLRYDQHANVPAVCISRHDDIGSRLAAFRAGMTRYLVKPVDLDRLVTLADELTARVETAPLRVLVADNDRYALNAHKVTLEAAGFEVTATTEALAILELVRQTEPDVVVLDVYMPEASGPEIAAVLRADDALSWLPILFLSAEKDTAKHARALAHGGDQFLAKPVRAADLQAAVKSRAYRSRQLRTLLAQARATAGA